ncbi:MAG TPA: pyridoxal phosphate-dependent aminotransferase [Phenylobacterium sp.]
MNPVQSNGAASAQPLAAVDDLFEAASYSDFVRGALRVKQARPSVAMLFESTISEPTAKLLEVIHEAFSADVSSRYVSVFADGNRYAIEAVSKRYGLAPDQIIATTGTTAALSMVFRALVAPGERVLVEQPGFDLIGRLAAEAGAVVDDLPRRAPDYGIDLADLADRLQPNTRCVVITNLHNPSGVRLAPEEIAAIAAVCARTGAVLVVDEVYADFAADAGAPPAASLAPNIISAASLTKVFGLFALKFGWLAAAPELTARIRQSAPDGDMGVSKLAHAVAAHVLESPEPFEAHWRRLLAANRPLLAGPLAALNAAGLLGGEIPPYGCMCFPRVVGVSDTRALARVLLRDFDVLVAPGEYFGLPGHIRIGFGAEANGIAVGLERLSAGLAKLAR